MVGFEYRVGPDELFFFLALHKIKTFIYKYSIPLNIYIYIHTENRIWIKYDKITGSKGNF